jgi:16S rRNA processing protein RimM
VESRESRDSTPRLLDPVVIGVVIAPHGVRGTVRVRALGAGKHLRIDKEPMVAGVKRRISAARKTPKGFLLDLEGVGSRRDADSLRGLELLLEREELDVPEEGAFYVADLVGLAAVDEAGVVVGSVVDSYETAAHEVLVVRGDRDGQEKYIPFTLEHVPEVDLGTGRLLIRPPEE